MTSNGMKDVNKTAFQLAAWMTAIVGIVAWRSDCDPMALALTGGFPLGVLTFWITYAMGAGSKQDQGSKVNAKAPKAVRVEAPHRPEPLSRKPLFTAAPEPPVPFKMAASVAAAEGFVPLERAQDASLSTDPTVPADGAFNFLNASNYLYQPSRTRDRMTTVPSGNAAKSLSSKTVQAQQGQPASLDIDREGLEAPSVRRGNLKAA